MGIQEDVLAFHLTCKAANDLPSKAQPLKSRINSHIQHESLGNTVRLSSCAPDQRPAVIGKFQIPTAQEGFPGNGFIPRAASEGQYKDFIQPGKIQIVPLAGKNRPEGLLPDSSLAPLRKKPRMRIEFAFKAISHRKVIVVHRQRRIQGFFSCTGPGKRVF